MSKVPKLKRNPFKIVQEISRMKMAEPAWVSAMRAIPPAPKPLPIASPSSVQFQCKENSLDEIWIKQKKFAFSLKAKKALKKAKAHYITTPPEIIYEEDEIRKIFYAQHPFELQRPRSLVYSEAFATTEWTSINGSEHIRVPLSGERFDFPHNLVSFNELCIFLNHLKI